MEISVANIVSVTRAEGPGKRFAIWFQGCPMRCAHCCNPEMLAFKTDSNVSLSHVLDQVDRAIESDQIEGITMLGGEPFAHSQGAAALGRAIQKRGLSVMVFSGYTLEQIHALGEPHAIEFLAHIDLLVDGQYDASQPDESRRWIGSTNQQIHFLTDRYASSDAYWQQNDTLEIRLDKGELSVNGFPAKSSIGFWKTLPRKKN